MADVSVSSGALAAGRQIELDSVWENCNLKIISERPEPRGGGSGGAFGVFDVGEMPPEDGDDDLEED